MLGLDRVLVFFLPSIVIKHGRSASGWCHHRNNKETKVFLSTAA
jgi:hypothetical protein